MITIIGCKDQFLFQKSLNQNIFFQLGRTHKYIHTCRLKQFNGTLAHTSGNYIAYSLLSQPGRQHPGFMRRRLNFNRSQDLVALGLYQ